MERRKSFAGTATKNNLLRTVVPKSRPAGGGSEKSKERANGQAPAFVRAGPCNPEEIRPGGCRLGWKP
jgi:hypothetical protein